MRVTPVTQQVAYISVQSAGPPQQQYPFEVSSFSRVLSEQSSKDTAPVPTSRTRRSVRVKERFQGP